MTGSLISIIMPCHNAASYLEEAVASVMAQTFSAWELIVVDDGSTDRSREILQSLQTKDKRIQILRQHNQGPYPARNLGLKHARGQFVAFLDADDWWDKDFLAKMHRALEESEADLAYCGWQNAIEQGQSRPPYVPPDYLQRTRFVATLAQILSLAYPCSLDLPFCTQGSRRIFDLCLY